MLRLQYGIRTVAPSGQVVIHGVMDPADLDKIMIGPYQRGQLPVQSVEDWKTAFHNGEVPPLDLGSRGATTTQTPTGMEIRDDIYVIDGLQRLTAARIIRDEGGRPFVPVIVYLDSTEGWENKRFAKLNGDRRKVHPSVLMRNARERNPAIAVMYALSEPGADTLLGGRVQWSQSPLAGNLFSAVTMLRVAAALHSHLGKGLLSTSTPNLSWDMADVVDEIGADAFAQNLNLYWQTLHKACQFTELRKSSKVVHLRLGYMLSLALLFSKYVDFWENHNLTVTEAVQTALADMRFDHFDANAITNSGRSIHGLVAQMAQAATGARRKALTPRA